jgi:hypothetical protein
MAITDMISGHLKTAAGDLTGCEGAQEERKGGSGCRTRVISATGRASGESRAS